MLTAEGLVVSYDGGAVLHGVSLSVGPGEIHALLGRNGAGKTTTLRAIMGLVRLRGGRVALDGVPLAGLRPYEIPRRGLAYVPQGRGLFPFLTVEENLRVGLLVRGGDRRVLDQVLDLFPVLRERLQQRAGTLSGGEQQMLAMARALCARPAYLLLDEPTEGLMPALVERIRETVAALRARGVGVLLVEQKVEVALAVADTVTVLETGRVRLQGAAADLAAAPDALVRYLGVRRA